MNAYISGEIKQLYLNEHANSYIGHQPVTHNYIKENKITAPIEGKNLKKQAESVPNYKVPESRSGAEVKFSGFPSLTDGKVRFTYLPSSAIQEIHKRNNIQYLKK